MGVLPLDLLERMDGDCLVAMVNVEEIFGQEALVHVVEGQSAVEERKAAGSAVLGYTGAVGTAHDHPCSVVGSHIAALAALKLGSQLELENPVEALVVGVEQMELFY